MTVINREFPEASCKPLRFQIGIPTQRAAEVPVFEGENVVGHRPNGGLVQTYRLIGYGSTPALAKARARQAAVRLGIQIEL